MCTVSASHHENVVGVVGALAAVLAETPDYGQEDCEDDDAADAAYYTTDDRFGG